VNPDVALLASQYGSDATTQVVRKPILHDLKDLLARPELLTPPPIVLPRLAWAGRLTLLAAPEKSGKSTLVGQAVAALATGGEFLGERTAQGTALWLALDESLNDVVRRFARHGVREGIMIATEVPDAVTLLEWIEKSGAVVTVIDTLAEFASGHVDDYNAASQWVGVLHKLRTVLQTTGTAGVLLHHTIRDGTRYRDSGQIGAGVDTILEMSTPKEDKSARLVRARGRLVMRDFRLRFNDPRYTLDDTDLPLDVRIWRVIETEPGASKRRVREAVYGSTKAKDDTLADLVRRGALETRPNGTGYAGYYTTSGGPRTPVAAKSHPRPIS
jgi:AAA domain-containing protein